MPFFNGSFMKPKCFLVFEITKFRCLIFFFKTQINDSPILELKKTWTHWLPREKTFNNYHVHFGDDHAICIFSI
jgi:hypothetical protein